MIWVNDVDVPIIQKNCIWMNKYHTFENGCIVSEILNRIVICRFRGIQKLHLRCC